MANTGSGQHRLWRRLADRIQANRYSQAPIVLMLDHVERAQADCLPAIERIEQLASSGVAGLTLILCVRDDGTANHSIALREIADLRIELAALDLVQTEQYVETLLFKAGATRTLFDVGAYDQLYRETAGIPRVLNRLCDMALLAGLAEGAPAVTDSIVAGAAEELNARSHRDRKASPHMRHAATARV
jgi:general secretion pathway protein A